MTVSQDHAQPTCSALEWSEVADQVLTITQDRLESLARKAADDMYESLLYSVQDYFADNTRFNIAEKIEAAERQARYDRNRAIQAETINATLLSALKTARDALSVAIRANVDLPDFDPSETMVLKLVAAAIAKAEGQS